MRLAILAEPNDDDDDDKHGGGGGNEEGRNPQSGPLSPAFEICRETTDLTEEEIQEVLRELFRDGSGGGVFRLDTILRGSEDTLLKEDSSSPHVCSSFYHRAAEHQWLLEQLEGFRTRIGIDPQWSIELQVCCPDELGQSEATIEWDAEVWYARLRVRCDLPILLMLWVLTHELYELFFWRTGNVFLELLTNLLSDEVNQFLERQYRVARNQEVEVLVSRLLEMRRPHHLMITPYPPRQRLRSYSNEESIERRWEEEEEDTRSGSSSSSREKEEVRALVQTTQRQMVPDSLLPAVNTLLGILLSDDHDNDEDPPWQ